MGNIDEDEFLSSVASWHELKTINETGEIILGLCAQNHFFISTSSFHHQPGHLYTWRSPNGHPRNQIRLLPYQSHMKVFHQRPYNLSKNRLNNRKLTVS